MNEAKIHNIDFPKQEQMVEREYTITKEDSGARLDFVLSNQFPITNRENWKKRIEDGLVTVNYKKSKPSRKVQSGDIVQFQFIKKLEPEVNKNFSFLYGMNPPKNIIAINKPADLPVHPSGIYYENTLTSLLKKQGETGNSIYLINRLDRETSGIVLVARTAQICKSIQKQFFNNTVIKEYIVFVEGDFPDYLDASGYIGKIKKSPIRKKMHFSKNLPDSNVMEFPQEWKECRTEFYCRDRGKIDTDIISQLKVRLHSGRTHQIRATLFSLGYPVVGDRLYGVDENLYLKFIDDTEDDHDRKKLRINRTALHCSKVIFEDPEFNLPVEINCELPEDLFDLQKRVMNQ